MSQRSFAVVTDSTADIEPGLAAERGIEVVPLTVSFGGESMPDGTLTQEEFFERMAASPELPTTSQPSPGAFVEAYSRALELADNVISVHISNRLSGTVESAKQAAEQFAGRVHVFDSLNLSWGLAFQVLDAARSASEGLSVEHALESLERVRGRVKMIVGVDSLDNLARGGRIGRVSAFLGSLLNLKVTFGPAEDGAFAPIGRDRGEKAALAHTIDWVAEKMGSAKRASFAVGYAMNPERAERMRQTIQDRFDVAELYMYAAGSVICAHTGTGWGVTVLPEG